MAFRPWEWIIFNKPWCQKFLYLFEKLFPRWIYFAWPNYCGLKCLIVDENCSKSLSMDNEDCLIWGCAHFALKITINMLIRCLKSQWRIDIIIEDREQFLAILLIFRAACLTCTTFDFGIHAQLQPDRNIGNIAWNLIFTWSMHTCASPCGMSKNLDYYKGFN